jgi:hypothetical protein
MGSYWEAGGLKALGVRFQVGHGRNGTCPNPIADDSFVIKDFRGTHAVALDYCGCLYMSHLSKKRHRWGRKTQLSRARLLREGRSEATTYDLGMPLWIQRETKRLFLELVEDQILDRSRSPSL